MSLSSTVRRMLAALCATAAGGAALLAPQAAVAAPTPSIVAPATTSGSTVNGLAFPGDAGFAYAGCYGWDGGTAPSALVRDLPGSPNGNRSTGFTTSPGTGAGPQAAVPSLKGLGTMDIGVWSEGGSSGFAYVWLFPSTGRAFLGTAQLPTTGAGWTTSDAADETFTWTERDRRTFATVPGSVRGGELTPRQAAKRFGNGPARVGFAFGCNGEDFSLDRFRVGAKSFDFEGIAVATTMSARRTKAGTALVGRSTGAGRSTGEPLVLQAARPGMAFRNVTGVEIQVDGEGVHTAVVRPAVTTRYRWRRLEVSYADGGHSNRVPVKGTKRDPKQGKRTSERPGARPGVPDPTEPPSDDEPTAPETEQPTEPSVPDPTEPPTEPETEQPTEPGTEQPTEPSVPEETEPPSEEPSPEPSPEPTPEPVACEGLTDEDTAVWLEAQGLETADITAPLDEDCPTADELDEMATELGIELELVPGITG